ncbi:cytochrome P450 monooxygenase, putative [Talaromyces stipitatus ATCC 10500]|uniref:Cytochrome P450 monooxygenase, putative n=1 Tax=Talaromyces stipitatus (strain ATCC 10500 / CBS 375.48 / QM 6759 / NRRL 1006) TaxID=441959 RepID=B8MRY2_TALSN|nr:cytochrome P450 monooxygenase, putative [Talaromyces stipitatus ATCC 10500]EED13418.1 cytochrome P450 monooxygenase, putative [Talaromyces stipitatus ATCC 10500]
MLLFNEELALNLTISLTETVALLWTTNFVSELSFKSLFLVVLAINFAIQLVWDLLIYPFYVDPLRHVATVPGKTNQMAILLDSPRGRLPLEWMRTIPNEGLIHFRDTFRRSYLIATSHQALLDVMSTNTYDFEKPWKVRTFLARILGFGLILSEGNAHRVQRRALTPAFNIKNIRSLYGLMWEKTNVLLAQLEEEMRLNPVEGMHGDGRMGKVEMSVWASRLTLDVIGPVAMGRDFQSLINKKNKVADSFLAILEPSREKLIFLGVNFLLPQWFARRIPWTLNRVVDKETDFLRAVCHDIVREKREALKSHKLETLEVDILGTIMLRGEFSDDELVDQMLTFLAAGHETTASALTWACYLLCLHPEVQTRLRDEIHSTIPSAEHDITWHQLESMPLLNGVCQEVLRLYPTVPATIREAVRDTTIANTRIPRGIRIILCPYAINRSPQFWGDTGDSFIPERWIDIDDQTGNSVVNHHGGAPTNFAQITFLHGQRSCIGKDFARAELRCAVAGVVGRFVLEMQRPEEEIHIAGAVTTKPKEGMHLKMTRVEGW